MSRFAPSLVLALALAGVFCTGAQAQETEPNNACQNAQDFGATDLPFSLFGALSPTQGTLDVDFFRFSVTPGESVRADLEGTPTGQGTLGDPYLGLFDAGCNLVAVNDDSGTLNSRLNFQSPADGIVVLGVTACCDGDFIGGGEGSYRLSLSRLAAIDSIAGQIVNGDTGEPLTGADFPFASAHLFHCDVLGCSEFVSFQWAGDDGGFLFVSDQFGNPLADGSYQVQAFAAGFDSYLSDQFEVAEGEFFDLGALPLSHLQVIGSVSGRVVDAVTGNPLSGFGPPFAIMFMERCVAGDCATVAGALPDQDGHFVFDGSAFFIPPGTFRLRGFAEDYREVLFGEFAVAAFEDFDVGDLALTPFQIRFGEVEECEIPPGGGSCEFGIIVSNQGPGRYRGEAWSTVELFTPNAVRNTRFQVGNLGTLNPTPQRVNLQQGQSTMLNFQLEIPATLPDGTFVCAFASVGQDPAPQFNAQGERFIFCTVKQPAGFEALSGKEGRRRYRELTRPVSTEIRR